MREKYQEYKRWKEAMTARRWFPFAEMALDLVLAVLTVFPLMWKLVRDVPFSYEVNDDAVIVQILNGSFTGTPDPHGIHVREPLTLLMTWLYEHVPDVTFLGVDFPEQAAHFLPGFRFHQQVGGAAHPEGGVPFHGSIDLEFARQAFFQKGK